MEQKYGDKEKVSFTEYILSGGAIITGLGALVIGLVVRDLDAIVSGAGLFIGGSTLKCGIYIRAYGESVIEYLSDHREG